MTTFVVVPDCEHSSPLLLHANGPNQRPGMICCAERLFSYSQGTVPGDKGGEEECKPDCCAGDGV